MNRLTKPILMEKVPAAFSHEPHNDVSDKYVFVPTHKIIDDMDKLGWYPVHAEQGTIKPKKSPDRYLSYVKHVIRFQSSDTKSYPERDGMIPQILLFNSHNRQFRFQLYAGIFRLVCTNGLTVSQLEIEKIRVRHMGISFDDIRKKIEISAIEFNKIFSNIKKYKTKVLSNNQKIQFAKKAVELRFGNSPTKQFDYHRFLDTKRPEDQNNDLWTVFNVLQENLEKGGISYTSSTENGDRDMTSQALRNPARKLDFNQSL